ncbi:hypothetical protein [Klebsiella quasipneumoniae]|nr:hypothetical protein [Klebsiella quasipneumoniae]
MSKFILVGDVGGTKCRLPYAMWLTELSRTSIPILQMITPHGFVE